MEVHAHSPGQTFNSKSSIIQGVDVIPNSLMRSYSVACSGILVSTNVRDGKIIEIHNHRDFNWNDTLSPVVNSKLETDIALTQEQTSNLIQNLNISHNRIHGEINLDTFNPVGSHKQTWTIVGSVLIVFLIILLIAFSSYRCYKAGFRCYRKKPTRVLEIGEFAEPLRPRRNIVRAKRPKIYTSSPNTEPLSQ